MFEKLFAELEVDLHAIAAGTSRPPIWRTTQILNNDGGLLADAKKFLQPNWWRRNEPRDASNREILRLVERGQLRMGDGQAEEQNQLSAAEIVEYQREKEKNLNASASKNRKEDADDKGESWHAYMGDPKDDARAWLRDLSAKVDTHGEGNPGWWGTLRDHVSGKPNGAKIRDLDQRIVELCLKNLCTE